MVKIVKRLQFPSFRGGVDATSRKYRRRHPWIGADGVVRDISDHPVCAAKVASLLFLIAQPPLLWRRGVGFVLNDQLPGMHAEIQLPRSWIDSRGLATSLMETVLVIAIAAILTSMAIVASMNQIEDARLTRAAADTKAIGVAIHTFMHDTGVAPAFKKGTAHGPNDEIFRL